jgi:hypothetical protein
MALTVGRGPIGRHLEVSVELAINPDGAALPAMRELRRYVANIRRFDRGDWRRYIAWIGTIASLLMGTSFFVGWGYFHGVDWPGYVWFIPLGTALFCGALAIDDIGHRTIYKSDLRKGEAYVHQMIVATAVPSVMALCLCYQHADTFKMAALGLILLSFFYSAIDEMLHWRRYLEKGIDRVEMWAHFVAIFGHVLMITSWWQWFDRGYQGVAATLATLPFQ